MKFNGTVRGTQAVKPSNVEINGNTVYIRGNIQPFEEKDGRDNVTKGWVYSEVILTPSEYDQAKALALDIPDDMWDDGLQTMFRTIRYERLDGAEQSAQRNIRNGVDVERNEVTLKAIDEYKMAVRATKDAPGYPNNVPVWPAEPEF